LVRGLQQLPSAQRIKNDVTTRVSRSQSGKLALSVLAGATTLLVINVLINGCYLCGAK